MARNYAALPYEYLEEMDALNDAEFGRLTRALLTYSMTGEQIALCGNERFYANRVMSQEDRFKASYEDLSSTRSAAGKAGADARWQNSKRIFANGKNSKAIVANGKNGNTETKTKTKTETETKSQLSNDSKGNGCAEPLCESASTPPVITLTLNDGTEYPVSEEQCHEWAGLYPAVNVIQQLRQMKAWLDANPTRRKTRRGIRSFVVNWLSKEQDKGSRYAARPQRPPQGGNVFLDMLREEETHGTQ